MLLGELFDFGDEFFDAAKGAPSDGFVGDDAEPALDLIEPTNSDSRPPPAQGQ